MLMNQRGLLSTPRSLKPSKSPERPAKVCSKEVAVLQAQCMIYGSDVLGRPAGMRISMPEDLSTEITSPCTISPVYTAPHI